MAFGRQNTVTHGGNATRCDENGGNIRYKVMFEVDGEIYLLIHDISRSRNEAEAIDELGDQIERVLSSVRSGQPTFRLISIDTQHIKRTNDASKKHRKVDVSNTSNKRTIDTKKKIPSTVQITQSGASKMH
eukprot:15430_1